MESNSPCPSPEETTEYAEYTENNVTTDDSNGN